MRLTVGAELCIFCRCLARWPMGGERIERRHSSVLGCKVWDRPIDVERPRRPRSVISEVDLSTLD